VSYRTTKKAYDTEALRSCCAAQRKKTSLVPLKIRLAPFTLKRPRMVALVVEKSKGGSKQGASLEHHDEMRLASVVGGGMQGPFLFSTQASSPAFPPTPCPQNY